MRDWLARRLDSPESRERAEKTLLFWGAILVVVTGAWNVGIIAMDDYYSLTAFALPAQSHSVAQIVADSEIRSPLPRLFLFGLARAALALGAESPLAQLRILLAVIGLLGFLVSAFSLRLLFPDRSRERVVWAFLIGFYFLCPLLLSRAMLESLAAPWVAASAAAAGLFLARPRVGPALLAALFLGVAFAFRFQAGVCGLALLGVVLFARRPLPALACALAGVCAFVGVGLLDGALRGRFHESLLAYFQYNAAHSSSYGRTPFYAYFLLFVALTIPPALVGRYRGLRWRQAFAALLPGAAYFVVFVGAHSLIPHKEERFMAPVLPIFLALLVPLVDHVAFARPERWRFYWLSGVNLVLLVLACANVPQQNVIGVIAFLNEAKRVGRVIDVDESLALFPEAYLQRPVERVKVPKGASVEARCGDVVAILKGKREATPEIVSAEWEKIASFGPGPLEAAAVRLNPSKNLRRGPVELYAKRGCAE